MAMGFGDDKIRVQRVFRNKKCRAVIDGKSYKFDSRFEGWWALYLQFLKEQGQIRDWVFHPITWDFFKFGYRNKPYEYTPDFLVYTTDKDYVYQELKGHIETNDISRFRRANEHYDAEFELVMQRLPKKGKGTQILARASQYAFVKRIIDASEILKQVGKVIDMNRLVDL